MKQKREKKEKKNYDDERRRNTSSQKLAMAYVHTVHQHSRTSRVYHNADDCR